jgi:hypothetical protein
LPYRVLFIALAGLLAKVKKLMLVITTIGPGNQMVTGLNDVKSRLDSNKLKEFIKGNWDYPSIRI